ncbi:MULTISPECIES: MerR family transcriptional regulator [unclassified Bacillus (in: firmicutes)]|uniref:MerR family transcriptional regulator n=1 Tax=unclassified Bacillus (in: firmicutes) TaxID=185979 RepID=UPI0022803E09|nr:MerR family transcriptional regulator [Bacillus sp. S20C3]MCY8205616.1 MerR family transcriptional regulator [Bacillus sp. N12A5]MCY8287349.1 MerR family transcriptional regulator [Bacillus sp. N13C7]MCY8639089.1 MerR family transcriptional regulator [Bacillus sp. S17B2]MCY8717930.1 MerR family transcriptional regulator [Bacillus sp. S10C12M]MCY9144449.1 MerR family transcriptional regulator [Bacillus sp. T9C1]
MNIKQVSELTGLTKKAIKYYESEGLIEVNKNPINQYREYSEKVISQLNLIASLRLLHLPVKEIKSLLKGERRLPELLNEQLNEINKNLKLLEQQKLLTETLIQNVNEIDDFSDKVKILEDTLHLKDQEKKEYIMDKILRMFPGKFGEFVVAMFEPFLEVTIDNESKQSYWLNLVNYLDDIEEVDDNHPIMKLIMENEHELESFKKNNYDFVNKIINKDPELFEQQKNTLINLVKSVKENKEYKENFITQANKGKDLPYLKEGSEFSNMLYKISPRYKIFLDNQTEIKKQADAELGFDSKQFLEDVIKGERD